MDIAVIIIHMLFISINYLKLKTFKNQYFQLPKSDKIKVSLYGGYVYE